MRIQQDILDFLLQEYKTDNVTQAFESLIQEKLDHRFGQADASRSVITAIGGKNRVAKKIIELMPPHRIYIEPFGNTASILLQKEPVAKEVYNDINDSVSNFFRVLRDNPIGLYNRCSMLPYSESTYREMAASEIPDDPVEKAVRFFYLSRAGYMGIQQRGFKAMQKKNNQATFYHRECERFYAIGQRLKAVEVVNKDFFQVIRKYANEPEALILADPPYYDGTDYYENAFRLKDHTKLARQLASIKGKAIVCHSKNYQIHKLYMELGFRCERIRTKYNAQFVRTSENARSVPIVPLYLYVKD